MIDEQRRRRDQDVPCASNDEALWIMSAGVPDVVDPITGQVISAIERDYDDDFVVDVDTIPCLTYTSDPTRMPSGRPTSGPTAIMMTAVTAEGTQDKATEDTEEDDDEEEEDSAVSTSEEEGETSSSSRSFYGCDIDDNGGNDDNGDDAASYRPPEGAVRLNLVYDYELHASSSSSLVDEGGGMLSSFEDAMAYDVANRYGLVDCTSAATRRRRRRRYLRSMEGAKRGPIAVDGSPADVSMADTYECESLSSSSNCIPMRGYMTAWLPSTTNLFDTDEDDTSDGIKAEILSYIEQGMGSDAYLTDGITKVVYLGERADTATKEGGGNDDGVADAASVSSVVASANVETAKEIADDDGDRRPLVAGGAALFVLAIVFAALLVAYHRRRKRVRYSDGPSTNDDVPSAIIAPNQVPSNTNMRDPDDVHLLPSSDKLDMRSVISDDDTENYSVREYDDDDENDGAEDEWAGRYATRTTKDANIVHDATEDYSDDNAVAGGGHRGDGTSRRSSDLAAMGMASMLVTQSRK